jgi:hypothetical protein
MNETNDELWLAFEALANTYPHDGGVRMTADLARWLLEEHQRLELPPPPIAQKAVRIVTQALDAAAADPLRPTPLATVDQAHHTGKSRAP